MPFFFIVSGYFHKLDEQESRYFKKKCVSLLVPYTVYLFILKLPLLSRLFLRIVENPSIDLALSFVKYLGHLAYGGETLKGEVGVFWFVTCLFLTQQFFNFMRNRISNQKLLLTIAITLYTASFLDQISPFHLIAPWNINVVGCAFLFYTVGAFYGKHVFNHHSRFLLLIATAISVVSIILLSADIRLSFDMKHAYYGYFILSPIAAFSLTKLLMVSTLWLDKSQWSRESLAFLGTTSVTIMYLHRVIEYNLPESLYSKPLIQSIIITLICCLLHTLFQKISLFRALLLGSLKDTKLIFRRLPVAMLNRQLDSRQLFSVSRARTVYP